MKKINRTTIFVLLVALFFPTICLSKQLTLPFTTQAPYGYWAQPWQDACEEATIVMVDQYYANKKLNPKAAKNQILNVLKIKNNAFGWSLDENAEKIKKIINYYFPWEARIVENPTIEQIKNEIDNNRPIIAPVHGKALQNPFFRSGGPDYHTVIIAGYDEKTNEFIVGEPGTKHGLDYRYAYGTIMNAIHDHVPGFQTKYGKKTVLFTNKKLESSANLDGDKDGLIKKDELKHGSILWLKDSDGDGYTDGDEVNFGYSPTIAENILMNGSLIKTRNSPKVYLLINNAKRHILNERVFTNNGWKWRNIITVSSGFLNALTEKEPITK